MPVTKTRLELRKERETAVLEAYHRSLEKAKKTVAAAQRDKKQKRKTPDVLLKDLHVEDIMWRSLRPAEDYQSRSYNYDRQLWGLADHLFVKYKTPGFMYAVLFPETKTKHRELFKLWFIAVSQGESFPKMTKGVMTRLESSVFLRAPDFNSIEQNIWWARCVTAGISPAFTAKIIDRILCHFCPITQHYDRLNELILFFARYQSEYNATTFGEVVDFLSHTLRHDLDFSLKGRTPSSVLKLSNEWHILILKAKLGHHVEWDGLGVAKWTHVEDHIVWTVTELRNNRELMNEGKKQRHCVYSYVSRCADGRSSIFSLRGYQKTSFSSDAEGSPIWILEGGYEEHRITFEINNSARSIIQVRGRLNSSASMRERDVIRLWAGTHGFTSRHV